MSTGTFPALITEEEYLTNPEYAHCELQVRFSRSMDEYLERHPIGVCSR